MRAAGRRRARRSGKLARLFKKTFINIVFAPTRIPKITDDTVELLMRLGEGTAIVFVAALVAHIALPTLVPTGIVVIFGAAFAVLLSLIKLSDYQQMIEKYRYYGFRI